MGVKTSKVERLTSDQEAQLAPWRDRWLAHGLSTDPADRVRAEAGVARAYREAGLEPPKIKIWLGSPYAGTIGAAMLANLPKRGQVRDQVGDQVGDQVWGQVRDQVWGQVGGQVRDQVGDQVGDQVWGQVRDQVGRALYGQHEAGYLSFYDYMHRVVGIDAAARLEGINEVAQSAGWWWPFKGAVVLTERPTVLHRDGEHRLHCESGPAVSYPDGWSVWTWHGTRVPEWAVMEPTADLIHAEQNIEIRRCAIERMGWDAYVAQAGLQLSAPVDDPGNPGQTLTLSQPIGIFGTREDELVRVLLCTNGTVERGGVRRRFGLTVPADVKDPVEAAAWSYGWPAHTYRQLQRRT